MFLAGWASHRSRKTVKGSERQQNESKGSVLAGVGEPSAAKCLTVRAVEKPNAPADTAPAKRLPCRSIRRGWTVSLVPAPHGGEGQRACQHD